MTVGPSEPYGLDGSRRLPRPSSSRAPLPPIPEFPFSPYPNSRFQHTRIPVLTHPSSHISLNSSFLRISLHSSSYILTLEAFSLVHTRIPVLTLHKPSFLSLTTHARIPVHIYIPHFQRPHPSSSRSFSSSSTSTSLSFLLSMTHDPVPVHLRQIYRYYSRRYVSPSSDFDDYLALNYRARFSVFSSGPLIRTGSGATRLFPKEGAECRRGS